MYSASWPIRTPSIARETEVSPLALFTPPSPPLGGGGTRDADLVHHVGDRSATFDAQDQGQAATRGQASVSVHLSLLGSSRLLDRSTLPPEAQLIGDGLFTTLVVSTALRHCLKPSLPAIRGVKMNP
jgi:hypothetical protein